MPVSDPDRDTRPATVWPCPPEGPDRTPAGWLQTAVEQLVATHTRPGDPVRLLTPPPDETDAPTDGRSETQEDLLAAIAGAVARLGRTVEVRPAPTAEAPRPSGSESGPDLPEHNLSGDRRPLVLTVVEPTGIGWLHGVPWADMLTPGGRLAVITHSDTVAGWLIDPTVDLNAATARHGLALLDRFVLLEVHLDELDQPRTPQPRRSVARRVHSDLFLFVPVAPAGPQERR
ncbi:hypothetical protein [Pseudofrankia sp. DC12]|uniref:hypothetical protein n=1 Tax=Pseudofrankia sp. DC12 TaxID=683315 RepID=UPI0005F7F33C|nr:hypothetical protein [Pseudofrankia sp. DC12]